MKNLIYANDISLPPFLVRSGSQSEFYSNSDMVSEIDFRQVGLMAKYGDNFSSVLDI